uniref:CSON000734 protein n=1 Tax=Culicoides sonorensis TaxID=179676 RepID=A0A336LTB6_CULSO
MITRIRNLVATQMLPRNLRISALLVAIYQVLIAHFLLFVMLLGLVHAEEMSTILSADIADHKEQEEYYFIPTLSTGESLNTVRFKSASHLAFVTLVILYIGTSISVIYLLSCLGLLIGTLRKRAELMLPWLILDSIGAILVLAVMVAAANSEFNVLYYSGGEIQYWIFCGIMTTFNLVIWLIVQAYYKTLRQMNKMRHVAAVPIPMPPVPRNDKIPYHYRKENMYLGENGLKHYVTDLVTEDSYLM